MNNSIEITVKFDMAHRITLHNGLCRNLHGHTYTVQVGVKGFLNNESDESSYGMLLDFKDLKKIVNEKIVEPFDHSTMIWISDPIANTFVELVEKFNIKVNFVTYPTTAENMAREFYKELAQEIANLTPRVKLAYVKVFETPTSFAQYSEGCSCK